MINFKLTEKQISSLLHALEMYSRLGSKQYDIIFERVKIGLEVKKYFSFYERNQISNAIRAIEGYMINGAEGINSVKISDRYRISYDLIQVLRYSKAWSKVAEGEQPKYYGVCHYLPSQTSKIELPKCDFLESENIYNVICAEQHIDILKDAINLHHNVGVKNYSMIGSLIKPLDENIKLTTYEYKIIEDFIITLELHNTNEYDRHSIRHIDDKYIDDSYKIAYDIGTWLFQRDTKNDSVIIIADEPNIDVIDL